MSWTYGLIRDINSTVVPKEESHVDGSYFKREIREEVRTYTQ